MTNEERMLAFRQMTQEEKNEMLFEAVTDLQKIANAYAAALEILGKKANEFHLEASAAVIEKLK